MALLEIMGFLGSILVIIFNSLDEVEIESGVSVLDCFLAILFLRLLMWFLFKILGYNIDLGIEASGEGIKSRSRAFGKYLGGKGRIEYNSVKRKVSNVRNPNRNKTRYYKGD